MDIKRPFFVKILFILMALFPGIFLANVTEVIALDEQSLIVGDIIALGNVDMQVMGNQSIKLNGSAMPVFSESKITTSDGQATLSLSDRSLIEISKDTILTVKSDEGFIVVKVEKGGIRFLLPSNSITLIETPAAVIGDKGTYQVASLKDLPILINNSERVGEVLVKNDGLSFINALKGNIKVTPLSGGESTIVFSGELLQVAQLERAPLPTPIPSFAPKEGYFWGWISENGAWEQVKLGTAPPTHSIFMKDLPSLPKSYVWGWDDAQKRWVWLKVKDGDLVVMRMKYKDKLGNWYWKEVTRSSPMAVETAKIKAVRGRSSISAGHLLGGGVVVGAIVAAAGSGGGGGGCSGASPSC